MSLSLFLLYLLTWSLVALSPGPAVMISMSNATRHGFRASVAGILGIQTGNALFFLCIAGGLATVLATATTAFTILRIAGALYLLYLGFRMIVATARKAAAKPLEQCPIPRASRSLFLQGLLVQLTNPKALLFVSALLPQFIEPHRSLALQLIALGAATVVIDLVVLCSYALLAERGGRAFRSSRLSIWLERTFGGLLILFGARLLVSRD